MSVAACLNLACFTNKIYREDFEEVMLFFRENETNPLVIYFK